LKESSRKTSAWSRSKHCNPRPSKNNQRFLGSARNDKGTNAYPSVMSSKAETSLTIFSSRRAPGSWSLRCKNLIIIFRHRVRPDVIIPVHLRIIRDSSAPLGTTKEHCSGGLRPSDFRLRPTLRERRYKRQDSTL
jgi:hypothetical protein